MRPRGPVTLPVEDFRGGLAGLRVKVNGLEALALLDTGAASTVLSPRLAKAAGVAVDWDDPQEIETSEGRERVGKALFALSVGPWVLNLSAWVAPTLAAPFDLLLGSVPLMDFEECAFLYDPDTGRRTIRLAGPA